MVLEFISNCLWKSLRIVATFRACDGAGVYLQLSMEVLADVATFRACDGAGVYLQLSMEELADCGYIQTPVVVLQFISKCLWMC